MSLEKLTRKGMMPLNKLVTVILVIVVVIAVLMIIFRLNINSFIRNLPGYALPEDDEILPEELMSDEEIKDYCVNGAVGQIYAPEGGLLEIGGKQRIYIGGEGTNFYWDADEEEGEVKIWKQGSLKRDVTVGEVEGGRVSVDLDFFDFDSVAHQEIRFVPGVNVSYLVKLHNSYYSGNNLLCAGEEVKVDYGWPEEAVVFDTADLELGKIRRRLKVDFSPYITVSEDSRLRFLYLKRRGELIEIRGDAPWLDLADLGVIYSDGSVWLDRERIGSETELEGVETKYRETYPLYRESNLRVDYDAVRSLL